MGDPIGITYDAGSGGPEYTAAEWRQAMAALAEGAAGQAFSGVKHDTGLVTLAGSTITHAASNFIIQGITSSTGIYIGYEPQATKSLTAAHATLNRVDAVWVRIQDHEADASGQRRSIVEYTAGTAGSGSAGVDGITGAPAAPATPYVLLATIAVPSVASGNPAVVTDRRTFYNPPPKVEIFTVGGSTTYTKPANVKYVRVKVQAGGGGSGGSGTSNSGTTASAGGAGGGGEYAEAIIPASALAGSTTVTVGAGGAGAASVGGTGSTAATSSFGGHVSAIGGGGGSPLNNVNAGAAAGGVGGTGGGGTASNISRVPGQAGDAARVASAEPHPARGGDSQLGKGGPRPSATNTSIGAAGQLYGGGAAGSFVRPNTAGVLGSDGANGVVIVESIFV